MFRGSDVHERKAGIAACFEDGPADGYINARLCQAHATVPKGIFLYILQFCFAYVIIILK